MSQSEFIQNKPETSTKPQEMRNMLQSFLSNLKGMASNDQAMETKRAHPRRTQDSCVISVHGQNFPVANWSFGGVLLQGDDRLFGMGQDIEFTFKFKLRDTVIEARHVGKVVRKSPGKIALQFEPLGKTILRRFQKVIDDSNAREFASSQAGLK